LEIGINAKPASTEKSFPQAVMSIRLKHAFLQPDYYSLASGVFDITDSPHYRVDGWSGWRLGALG
jgi:hypothetical protein